MRCPNCNQEIPDFSKFCIHCGTKIIPQSEETTDVGVQVEDIPNQVVSQPPRNNGDAINAPQPQPPKKKNKAIIIIIALIAACAIGLILFLVLRCNHQWEEATCIAPMTCSVCGKEKGKALGHEWVEATCTTPKTCSRCKETAGKALGHDYEYTVTQEPTCSKKGQKEG